MHKIFDNIRGFFREKTEDGPMPVEEALTILEEKDAENDKEEDPAVKDPVPKEVPKNACFQGSGKITYVDEHYGIIEETLYFDNQDSYNVSLDQTVTYLAYTLNNVIKVYKILPQIEGEWDAPAGEVRSVYKRIRLGKVRARDGRLVNVDPGDVTIDLNKVESEFIPMVGDWVELISVVEVDEKVANCHGDLIDVTKISPVRHKTMAGVIKQYDSEMGIGVINNDVRFWQDACVPGYVPIVRDKVNVEVIESEQGICTFRAVKVVPCDESTNKCYRVPNNPEKVKLFENKGGITVTNNIMIGLSGIGQETTFVLQIKNGSEICYTIIDVSINMVETQITLLSPCIKNNLTIHPQQTQIFKFMVHAQFMGMTKELLIFDFDDFKIGRWIKINVTPTVDRQEFIKNYYQRNEKNLTKSARESFLNSSKDVIVGERPVKPPSFISNKLPMYDVPERVMTLLYSQMESCQYVGHIPIEKFSPSLSVALNISNYEDRFHCLLYLEELALSVNMRRYDIERACFIQNNEYLMLEVQDLSERRPSIIVGDRVYVTNPNDLKAPKCEGFVHKTGAKHLFLKFNARFHKSYNGEDYSVEFHSSRTNFRRYHQAVDLAVRNLGKKILFPSSVPSSDPQINVIVDDDDLISVISNDSSKSSGYCSATEKLLAITPDTNEVKIVSKYVKMARTTHLSPRTSTSPPKQNGSPQIETILEIDASKEVAIEPPPQNGDKPKPNKFNSLFKENATDSTPLKMKWFDKNLNHFQKAAVVNILRGEARPLPYFIFGPPGTGKTVTLIETILQIIKLIPHSRILVVTPSNSAADLIALRLLDAENFLPGEMVRMVAFRVVAEGSVPQRLVPYCSTGDLAREGSRETQFHSQNGIKIGVQQSELGRNRITIGTCMVVGVLYTMGFSRGHFSHIIVDEAGQATEPEMMIPLSLLDVMSAQTVLAGDPLQLGPCVFSLLSKEHGLGESFFERIITRFPYVRDPIGFPESNGYDPRLVTRLIYNYRSIPEILKLPNRLFYNSELIPVISGEEGKEVDLLKQIASMLPEPREAGGLPPSVMFHGVRGENYQTIDCPSWFNPVEAGQVFYYVNDLYRLGLKAQDIGIITPYIKQGQQVRKLLNQAEMEMPKIGSVEEFQGQEFRVVILSTVRSNETGAKNDARYGLGFIASPRRLNVAITRAQSLLIIIGNPHLLYTDNYWRSVLIYAQQIGGYRGCDLPNMYD